MDRTKLQFSSKDPIDKIVASGAVTYTNDGNTTTTGTNGQAQQAKIQTNTITNPYGKAVFVRYIWSVDGVNFNASTVHLLFSFTETITSIPVTSTPMQGLRAAVSIGVSNSTIYFLTGNGYHGNVVITHPGDSNGYTPISQTFIIKYVLYEKL